MGSKKVDDVACNCFTAGTKVQTDEGEKPIEDIQVGDLLVTSDGSKLSIDKIEKEPRVTTVYNFEVKDFNSYFVSNLGVWVHNCEIIAGKNFKAHFLKHKTLLEKTLGTKYSKLEADGPRFLEDIGKMIDDGTVSFIGQGTINKNSGLMNIYRGNGLTVVTKPDGEQVTLLESGKGMDLNIVFK
ncbi:Hint domain-containing protein [Paenibacillus sp. CAU 1523]|uniref:Hint domain-containing protein n=1 Tax=Paenibacillus arenosi TaxID=2774142 RepID=A0ABR9AS71_9BACL|nr:polymorphic toxin-type HINT domain-containing protein [Paenibacillus arenosi]MBD8496949.1 Hint domain-containing protein [Paenibacillus arenosi]